MVRPDEDLGRAGQSVVIPDVGHFLAEEAPDEMLAALTEFLTPFGDGQAARPHAAAVSSN